MKKSSKSIVLFLAVTLFFLGAIAYLGFRTIEHEALLRHYQMQTLAQSRIAQVDAFIQDTLNQKAVRITSMMDFIQIEETALKELVSRDSDIEAIFILQKNMLIFPDERGTLTQKEQQFITSITPVINDPTMLYSHAFVEEKVRPQSGWFITRDASDTMLIYWLVRDDKIFGFKVSYIKFLADIVGVLEVDFSPDILTVKDNDKVLYQSRGPDVSSLEILIDSKHLAYPLTNWQIDYYAQRVNNFSLYAWGSLIIFLLVIALSIVMLRLYHEYTQAKRLARQQVNFVGQVSHELKTPLTNINLYAEMLKEEYVDQDVDHHQIHYLDVITSEAQRLSRLIQNILSFTKASKVHIKVVDIKILMEKIVHAFVPAFNAKNMKINLLIQDNIEIATDEDRLTQIISNFLSNAEKYASSSQQVDLRIVLEKEKKQILIQVRDYGQGIPAKELKSIFQPFYRVKSEITEGVSGTGIGLTIAKQLAHSLNGDIVVENMSPGAQFTLILPFQAKE